MLRPPGRAWLHLAVFSARRQNTLTHWPTHWPTLLAQSAIPATRDKPVRHEEQSNKNRAAFGDNHGLGTIGGVSFVDGVEGRSPDELLSGEIIRDESQATAMMTLPNISGLGTGLIRRAQQQGN
ncbi:hypothetical protein F4803DRAFT_548686 [Xylaria telfairii]|nr:hypothetical protein F4803DRAFT_548686 [Xylaria telfairii]